MAREPSLKVSEGGRVLVSREVVHPASMDPSDVLQELAAAFERLRASCPPDYFIKYAKAECDGLREGVPKGRRVFLNVVFQRFPKSKN